MIVRRVLAAGAVSILVSHRFPLRYRLPAAWAPLAAASRAPSAVAPANFFLASASHLSKSGFARPSPRFGMREWLTPQIWLHSP